MQADTSFLWGVIRKVVTQLLKLDVSNDKCTSWVRSSYTAVNPLPPFYIPSAAIPVTSSLICIHLLVWSTPSCSRQWRFVASRSQPSIVFRHNSKHCLPCSRRERTNEPVHCDCNVWLLFSAAVPWCEKMIRYTFRTETAGEYQYVFTECFPIRCCTYGEQLRDFVFGKSLDIHATSSCSVASWLCVYSSDWLNQ